MGSITSQRNMFNQNQQETVSRTTDYEIIRNLITRQCYQKHHKIFTTFEEFESEKKLYLKRQLKEEQNIVTIQAIKQRTKNTICSSTYELTLYFQHPSISIDSIQQQQFIICVYLLLELLKAMKYLLQLYPTFVLDQSHIFINSKGAIKVWISNNFSDNTPSNFENCEQFSEQDKVQKIIDIIQTISIPHCIPITFIKPLRFNYYSIQDAISYIKRYCSNNKINPAQSLQFQIQKYKEQMFKKSTHKFRVTQSNIGLDLLSEQLKPMKKYNHSVLNSIVNQIHNGQLKK